MTSNTQKCVHTGELRRDFTQGTILCAYCQMAEIQQLRAALEASTSEILTLQPDALRYRWLMADADRCGSIIGDAYSDWDTDENWRETVEAEITERGYALPGETSCDHSTAAARGVPGDLEIYCDKCGQVLRGAAETSGNHLGESK